MKIKRHFFTCILMGLLGMHASQSFAADPTLYYYFEDNSDSSQPTNSGEAPFTLHYLGDTQQTTTQAKFGKGSMLIGESKGKVSFGTYTGFASMPSDFNDAISKLTITTWVRPSAQKEDAKNSYNREGGFNVLGRMVEAQGPGYFNYDYSYKAFNFSYYSDATKSLQRFHSSPMQSAESNEWVHMAVTFDQGKVSFYFNGLPAGEEDGTPVGATTISAAEGRNVLIGFFSSLPGDCIDDFGFIVGRALSAADIDAIYNKGLEAFVKPAPKVAPVPKK